MADNENGFVLITAMLMLVVLTLIGFAATNTTIFELQVADNERVAYQRFHVADSAWKQIGPFLNIMASRPGDVNIIRRAGDLSREDNDPISDPYYRIVRNYGNGADGVLNDLFPAGSEDGSISNIPYWYRAVELTSGKAPGFDINYKKFTYFVSSNAANTASISARISKVFKVGYK